MTDRDCANCKHHTEDGCSSWDCEYEPKDLISRADAIEAVRGLSVLVDDEDYPYFEDALKALPSADAEPTVIRSKTLMPTKDFKEWAKRIKEENPNAIVIPCDAEVVSADAVQGEWIITKEGEYDGRSVYKTVCSECGHETFYKANKAHFCPNCGARMTPYKGGDDK